MSVSFEVLEQQIDSILEESISNDAYLFEKRKENLEKPELVKQVIDALKLGPSSATVVKKKSYIKKFGGGSWPKGLGKGAFILSLNKASEPRIYDIGAQAEAEKWKDSGAPEEKPVARGGAPVARGGAYKFMGQTKSIGLPQALQEDKLVEIVIDFAKLREQKLDESFLAMFGGWVEHILKAMFGGFNIPVAIRGSDREVQSFGAAIGSEKRYIDVAKRYGLDHPSTYRSKAQLQSAAKNFERDTGIKWPFK